MSKKRHVSQKSIKRVAAQLKELFAEPDEPRMVSLAPIYEEEAKEAEAREDEARDKEGVKAALDRLHELRASEKAEADAEDEPRVAKLYPDLYAKAMAVGQSIRDADEKRREATAKRNRRIALEEQYRLLRSRLLRIERLLKEGDDEQP